MTNVRFPLGAVAWRTMAIGLVAGVLIMLLTETWLNNFGYAPIGVAVEGLAGLVFGLIAALAARAGRQAESSPGSTVPAVIGSVTYVILAAIVAIVTVFGNWQGVVVGVVMVVLAAVAILWVIRRHTGL